MAPGPVLGLAALLRLVAPPRAGATVLAQSLPLHHLQAIGTLAKRELEEKWADVQVAEWASSLCEQNGSRSQDAHVRKEPSINVAPVMSGPFPVTADIGMHEPHRPQSATIESSVAAGLRVPHSGFAAQLQAAHLDLVVLKWRAKQVRPLHACAPVVAADDPRADLRLSHLRPVCVAFREHEGGRTLQHPGAGGLLATSLEFLWGGSA